MKKITKKFVKYWPSTVAQMAKVFSSHALGPHMGAGVCRSCPISPHPVSCLCPAKTVKDYPMSCLSSWL